MQLRARFGNLVMRDVSQRLLFLVVGSVQLLMTLFVAMPQALAAPVTPPDMQMEVPTNDISIGTNAANGDRQLQYTHISWDAGTGPFEIDPTFNSTTGTASFVQSIYNSPSPGVWALDHTVPLATTGVFDTPSDYQFPLTKFTLNNVNADGSLGAAVAVSPKTDYCMTGDTYVGGVPNTPNSTFIPQSNCTDPSRPLGWSVGWGDQYDQTDSGQPIDLTGIPDGTYILHGVIDPSHVLTESNTSNNVTDTKIQIAGTTVTVLSQTNPTTTIPTVTMTSPTNGANVSGTVALAATATAASPATISSVQFLLDGQPLGSPVTSAPYTYNWVVGSTPLGNHTLSARAVDSNGNANTAPVLTVVVTSGSANAPTIDQTITQTGAGAITTAPFSTSATNETLVAFTGSDGPAAIGSQTTTVSGGGLVWNLVKRSAAQPGDTEIWTATAASLLSNVTVTSTPSQAGYDQQLTVIAFKNAGGIGASAAGGASTGAPSVALTSRAAGSAVYATGSDYDNAVSRTLGTNQALTAQWVDTTHGDTFWTQNATNLTASAGQIVTMNDTAPTNDHWNMAAAEILPTSTAPSDTTPPAVALTNPTAGQTVSGTTPVAANATDNVAVASVQFFLDGTALGSPVTAAPYAINWDTTQTTSGTHTLAAVATDTSGNQATAASVAVTVQNPAPPMTCFVMQAQVSAHGSGTVATSPFHTAMAGEVLVAFVSADGPQGANKQSVTVSGGGLSWSLVKRVNAQSGDAEIWTANAPAILTNATVQSAEARSGYAQDLTVIAMEGVKGVGASAGASAASGAPNLNLTTTAPTSLVFAVGNDWDNAVGRTLPSGWTMLDQWVNTRVGDTYWSQYTNTPISAAGTVVQVGDTAPTTDRWDMAAVELLNDGQ